MRREPMNQKSPSATKASRGFEAAPRRGLSNRFWGEPVPQSAAVFVLLIIAMGLPLIFYSLFQSLAQQPGWKWLALVGLTIVANLFSVRIPLMRAKGSSLTIGLGEFFIFVAMLVYGPAVAVVVSVAEGLVSVQGRASRLYKKLFNLAQVALVAGITALVFYQLRGVPAPLDTTQLGIDLGLQVLACALLYFLLNTLIVAAAVALTSGKPLVEVWKGDFLWISPNNFVHAGTALAVFLSSQTLNWSLTLAILPLILGVYYARKVGLQRLGDQASGEMEIPFFGHLLQVAQKKLFGNDALSGIAKGYLAASFLAGIPILLYCLVRSVALANVNLLYLVGLSVVATCFPVRIVLFKKRIWITLNEVFIFLALLHFGPEAAVMIAFIEGVVFHLRRRTKQPSRIVPNLAQIVLAAFVMGSLFELLRNMAAPTAAPPTQLMVVLITAACGLLYFVLTSGMMTLGLALARQQSFLLLWRKDLNWVFLTVFSAVAGALVFLSSSYVP